MSLEHVQFQSQDDALNALLYWSKIAGLARKWCQRKAALVRIRHILNWLEARGA